MDSKNSRVTFVTKIIFWRTFVIITSCCNVIRDNTKLEGQFKGIGQSSPASLGQKLDETLEDDASASQAELYAHLRLISRLISCPTLKLKSFLITSNLHDFLGGQI